MHRRCTAGPRSRCRQCSFIFRIPCAHGVNLKWLPLTVWIPLLRLSLNHSFWYSNAGHAGHGSGTDGSGYFYTAALISLSSTTYFFTLPPSSPTLLYLSLSSLFETSLPPSHHVVSGVAILRPTTTIPITSTRYTFLSHQTTFYFRYVMPALTAISLPLTTNFTTLHANFLL